MIFFCPSCSGPGSVGDRNGLILFGVANMMGCPKCRRVFSVNVEMREVGRLDDHGKRALSEGDPVGPDLLLPPALPDPERT